MLASLALAMTFSNLFAEPIPVTIEARGGKFRLMRDGKPFVIKGVGGVNRIEEFVAAGGNAMRSWGVETAERDLAECQKHGLGLMLGVWLGHKSYFDYANPKQVKDQYEAVKQAVLKHRNHPALLIWGIGNEMEINNDTPELWKAIEDLCRMVKELDPNHPTATVVAEISPEKIQNIKKYCPSLDILGINSYGGLASLPKRLKEYGWTKPYLIAEFGPIGPWEVTKTTWGAAFEPTSTEKAKFFETNYQQSINSQSDQCLGSFAFLWGYKQEETPTWFGMFLPTGERTQAVEVMTAQWGGKVTNQAPRITQHKAEFAGKQINPGSSLSAQVTATDPDQDPLAYEWEVRFEATEKRWAGEGEKVPAKVGESVLTRTGTVTIPAPTETAAYRLYVTIRDGKGNAATVNWPFKVVP